MHTYIHVHTYLHIHTYLHGHPYLHVHMYCNVESSSCIIWLLRGKMLCHLNRIGNPTPSGQLFVCGEFYIIVCENQLCGANTLFFSIDKLSYIFISWYTFIFYCNYWCEYRHAYLMKHYKTTRPWRSQYVVSIFLLFTGESIRHLLTLQHTEICVYRGDVLRTIHTAMLWQGFLKY